MQLLAINYYTLHIILYIIYILYINALTNHFDSIN